MANNIGMHYLEELEMEAPASRKCVERIPGELFHWKPHERSMEMGYLALLVAEIPRWIVAIVDDGEVNFGTFKHSEPATTADLLKEFDANMEAARKSLRSASDEVFSKTFELKAGDKVLMSGSRNENVMSSINHLAHHRGQLTVYMRLNNIPVPPIYGPTADEKHF